MFVPLTAPGDVARIRITELRARFGELFEYRERGLEEASGEAGQAVIE